MRKLVDFIVGIIWVPIKFMVQKITPNNALSPITTVNQEGVVSSFTRGNGSFRLISTLFHPNGCYQTAIFSRQFGDQILGYKLTATQEKAIRTHVETLNELIESDPMDWTTWTTDPDEFDEILYLAEPAPEYWQVDLLEDLLREHTLPPIQSRRA